MAYQFKYITASGTFDRLHQGHEAFFKKAFEISKHVFIGVTSDEFVKKGERKQYASAIEPFKVRRKHVADFLKKYNLMGRAEIFRLDDVYGPTLGEHSPIEAILVTEKTLTGAAEVNRKRKELGFSPLQIIKTDLIKTENKEILSSTHLRRDLVLPQKVRPMLKRPLGRLLRGREDNLQIAVKTAKKIIEKTNPTLIVTVGDVVTRSFNQMGIPITLAIVDFKVKREETIKNLQELGFTKDEPDAIVQNPPGRITRSLSKAIREMLNKAMKQFNNGNNELLIIRVLGEEDLAVLPAIIHAPPNTLIFYGQPGEGIVFVRIDRNTKRRAFDLLSQFILD